MRILKPSIYCKGDAGRTDLVRNFLRADLRRATRRVGYHHSEGPVQRVGVQVPGLAAPRPLRRHRCRRHLQHGRLGVPQLRGALGVGQLHRQRLVRPALAVASGFLRPRGDHARGVLHSGFRDARRDDPGQHVAPG